MAPSRLPQSDTLADILERVLETGVVVAGDIRVNLNDVELLTIQIRLIICSVDKAQEMGMDWWKDADYLNAGHGQRLDEGAPPSSAGAEDDGTGNKETEDDGAETARQLAALNERLASMEQRLDRLAGDAGNDTAGNDAGGAD
jgi:hypothetical protein